MIPPSMKQTAAPKCVLSVHDPPCKVIQLIDLSFHLDGHPLLIGIQQEVEDTHLLMECQSPKQRLLFGFVWLSISYHNQNLLFTIYYLVCSHKNMLSQVYNLICHVHNAV